MDNATYCYSTDYTPLTTGKGGRKAAHTAIHMGAGSDKVPQDYLVWSLCNFLYVNFCCLGFFALLYSIKARDQKTLGNLREARENSEKAKWYNILASGWNCLVPLMIGAVVVLLVLYMRSSEGSLPSLFGEEGFQRFIKHFSQ
ncbi:interferon-induced transmembrane protein 5-like [Engraulis encrasicolus]|uniref:interferon-induced transmembrane protein 5-like n=1 Tax=Engraulis encrasicolus TaxID=184585 RepID=UPI002FCFECD6